MVQKPRETLDIYMTTPLPHFFWLGASWANPGGRWLVFEVGRSPAA